MTYPLPRAFLLAYCRIDELSPEEEPVLEAFAEAAETYLTQAGISRPAEEDASRIQGAAGQRRRRGLIGRC